MVLWTTSKVVGARGILRIMIVQVRYRNVKRKSLFQRFEFSKRN